MSEPKALLKTTPDTFGDPSPDRQRFLAALRDREGADRGLTIVSSWMPREYRESGRAARPAKDKTEGTADNRPHLDAERRCPELSPP